MCKRCDLKTGTLVLFQGVKSRASALCVHFGEYLLQITSHDYDCIFFPSYLHYGLLAARAEVLKAGNGNGYSNCMLERYQGTVAYLYSILFYHAFPFCVI